MSRTSAWIGGFLIVAVAGLAAASAPAFAFAQSEGRDKDRIRKRIEVRGTRGSGRLGVRLSEVDKDDVTRLKLGEERGALVEEVVDDSPAEKAGLNANDVVVRFQGETIHSAAQLARLVRESPAGRNVSLEVIRDGTAHKLSATLAEGGARWSWDSGDGWFEMFAPEPPEPPDAPEPPGAPAPPAAPKPPRAPRAPQLEGDLDRDIEREIERGLERGLRHGLRRHGDGFAFRGTPFGDTFLFRSAGPRKLGIEYQEVTGQLAKYFKLAGDEGVLVSHVDDDGPAAKAGIKAGDVILKLDGKSIESGGDLRDAVADAKSGSEVAVTVQRDGRSHDLKVTLAGDEPRRARRSRAVS